MSNRILRILAFLCLGQVIPLWADVHLPPIISDHMVLARSHSVPVWGKADSGEPIAAEINSKTWRTVAGADGRWRLRLDLESAGAGPFQLVVKGRNQVIVSDVLIGTVWVASGQSNMEFPLQGAIGADQEIAHSANPLLRVFRVAKIGRREPVEDCDGHWVVAGPESAGAFTAVGYYFAKRLQRELHLPVGIIDASWSGTYSELWMSADAIRSVDALRTGDDARRALVAAYAVEKQKFVADYKAWLDSNSREDRPCPDPALFAGVGVSLEGWSAINLPGKVFDQPVTGAVWIRKDLDIPETAIKTGRDFGPLLPSMKLLVFNSCPFVFIRG